MKERLKRLKSKLCLGSYLELYQNKLLTNEEYIKKITSTDSEVSIDTVMDLSLPLTLWVVVLG